MGRPQFAPSRIPAIRPVAPEHVHYPYQQERPETTGSNHKHWGITAFQEWGGEDRSQMIDSVSVEVEAESEQEAIARAQDIITRHYYRISWVKEVCTKDEALKNG